MNKKIIATFTITFILALLFSGCQSMTALEKFNTASAKLKKAENVSMDMEIVMSYNTNENDESNLLNFLGQDISMRINAKYSYPEKNSKENIKEIEMAMEMKMSLFGEDMIINSYFKDGMMYMAMPSFLDELIRIDMESPDFEEISSSGTSMQPDDFLIDAIDEDSISITDETINYMGNSIESECIKLTITEENLEQLYDVLGSTADTTNMDTDEMLEKIDFDNFIYKVYIDNNNNILRFELAYGISLEGTGTDDTMDMKFTMVADIYDVNDTTVEFPDLTDAIDYSDFQ